MAIQKRVRILVRAHADGVSTSFSFDLLLDPYWVGEQTPGGAGGQIMNWFAVTKHAAPPVGVMVIDGAQAAALAGTVVTVTVPVKPEGSLYEVYLGLNFV